MGEKSGIAFCPCCGSLKTNAVTVNVISSTWAVSCQNCGIYGPFREDKFRAIAAWNSLPRMQGIRYGADHEELFKEMGIYSGQVCGMCKVPYEIEDGWAARKCGCRSVAWTLLNKKKADGLVSQTTEPS